MPAAKPGRQEVMNAGPHHAKIKVTANVTSAVYVAGSEISGKIDVECRAEKGLGLGTIMVELMAFQELNSRDHAATSTFIHTRRVFQGPGLPPSNAVLPEDEKGRFPPHHFPARRGITTFFFRFPLPLTSPASVDFGSGLAKIRYEVRASASVAWKGEMRLVTDSQEVQVVESAMQEVESAGTVVGESGKIWVQGKVLGGAVIAGQTCCIELHVKNHSSRKTTGVNVTLQRMLHLDNPPPEHANLILSDTLVTAAFHSAEYCCPPGLEGVAKLVINVPRTARTVKGGSRESGEAGVDKTTPALFDIRGAVNVRLCMGVGAKDLVLNLPVVISHPAALAPEAQNLGLPNQDPAQMRASSPHSLYDPPRSPFPPSQSPVLAQPTGYSSYPVAASPTLPYTQLYFPPPSPQLPHILSQFPAPPTSPGLLMSPVLLMSPGHAMSPVLPMSPVHPMPVHVTYAAYPHTTSPVYSPPRSPSPRRALPQPPQRRPQSKPKGLAPNPPPAEPHVHEVGTPLSPSADPVEGKGTRALRISEHLKMSSRTRSMSPTGPPIEPPPPEVVAEVEPAVLSPRPVHTALTEVMDRVGSADIQGLERMVAEDEAEKASIREAKEVRCVDRKKSEQLENRSPGRALPRPPSRAGNASQNAPPMPQVESSNKPPTSPKKLPHSIGQPPAPVVKPLQPRRLTIRPEQPPLPPTSPTPSPLKEEPTIDWGEIARVGKLKSFAAAHKKPTIPAFAVPELPPASFVKPQPTIVRKPDLPILSQHRTPASSHPPSPPEARPLMRYELMDNPMPKAVTESSTPISLASAAQSPSTAQPPQEIHREVPSSPSRPKPGPRPTSFQTSVPATTSPMTEAKPLVFAIQLSSQPPTQSARIPAQRASPTPTPPQSRPTSRPAPATEHKPLVRYELTDNPMPKASPRPKVPEPLPAPPQPAAPPQQTQTQGGSRHTAFKVTSSPVIETQPLGPSDLAYEPISFTRIEPHALDATKNIPQSPIREPTNLANVNQPSSPTRPKPESPAKPALSDGPVSKAPVRYQLDDPPVSEPPTTSPAVRAANLRPVSARPPASIPLPQSPTKVAASAPPFPRLEDRAVNAVLPPSSQTTSPKRREPSPRRPRPQDPPAQPTVPVEGDVFGSEQRISPNPQRGGAESQAAQKAKYFESLSMAKRNSPPEKLQPAPQNVRQILQPHQANTSQPSMGTRYAQVQIQPPPSQPQPRSPPRMAPIRTAPSGLEISAPRPIPSPRAVQASPILNYDMPLRSPSPVFTANPVPPTLPTARSLIPITSSGFEVPVVLPGRDARERADAALREAELFRLKREAITRVPMWLGNEYTPQAPPPTRAVRSFTTMELPPQSYWDIQQPGYEEPSMAELLSRESTPVSRAAYDPQLRHPRPRPVSSKPPPALLPSDKELMDKHNIQQSARGGRGGQVTAVTSIWENGKSGPVPTPASERKPQAKRFTAPVGMFGITAKGVLSNEGTSAGMIKSTSVPAMVHTSQAVPVLSSTASLARPIGGPSARTRMIPFAPSIPESQSDDALIRKVSQSSDNIPVGQARLKELIGKYQS
ncbi:hypothetical protein B0J17DRAFT_647560 [Rhizoctonia solani]|nr:hypothetical protein B0J17DRAFT_647560 [Rhizoctonia solani]